MNDNKYTEWFNEFGKAWTERDPHKIANLFSKDVEYYESVFDSPCESWESFLDLWNVVPKNQRDITFEFQVIAAENDLAVANWQVSRTLLAANQKQMIDGIFVIKLNDEGRCKYFKQWRAVKEV